MTIKPERKKEEVYHLNIEEKKCALTYSKQEMTERNDHRFNLVLEKNIIFSYQSAPGEVVNILLNFPGTVYMHMLRFSAMQPE